jgi:hypothetical protein
MPKESTPEENLSPFEKQQEAGGCVSWPELRREYLNLQPRDLKERMQNVYDRVCDALGAVSLPIRLPVAIIHHIGAILNRDVAEQERLFALFVDNRTNRAYQRWSNDADRAYEKKHKTESGS